MTENDFVPRRPLSPGESGKVSWTAPSNIALVKYWGKKGEQLPANASLSFTLSDCKTQTSLEFEPLKGKSAEIKFDIFLDGKSREDFRSKIQLFLSRIQKYFPVLPHYRYSIHTSNTFPHSSGIASSASGMAALAACFTEMEALLTGGMETDFFMNKVSFLARLGSGSAGRSIQGNIMEWGQHPGVPGSSDLYAIPYPFDLHPVFHTYRDTILLVETGIKRVSSSSGHELMLGHPFAGPRFEVAGNHIERLRDVFKNGDLDTFIEIVEHEALALHAMMMTSSPSFILMRPATLSVIEAVRDFRNQSGIPICFTLDAGANVHLLYPEEHLSVITRFIQDQLVAYCQNGHYLCDKIGKGIQKA